MNEMTRDDEMVELEVDIELAKEKVALGDSLLRLHYNEDFKKVFVENLLRDEASRVVIALADPNMQRDDLRRYFHNMIITIGHLKQYMNGVLITANQAEKAIEDAEEARQELLAEEA